MIYVPGQGFCLPIVNQQNAINWGCSLNDELVNWWKVMPGQLGGLTWRDINPRYANNGVLTNMEPSTDWSTQAHRGGSGSLVFDSTDEYADLGSPASLAATNFTWSGWVYLTESLFSTADRKWIFSHKAGGGANGDWDVVVFDGTAPIANEIYFQLNDGSWNAVDSSTVIPLKEWTHIAVVHKPGVIAIYVNGKFDQSTSFTDIFVGAAVTTRLGAQTGVSPFSWAGNLDDICFWNRVLSDAEIARLYQLQQQIFNPMLNWISANVRTEAAAIGATVPIFWSHYRSMRSA